MIIDFNSLEKQQSGVYTYSEHFDLHTNPFLDTGLEFDKDFYVEFSAKRVEDDYLIDGKYSGKIFLICDKCGKKYLYKLSGKFNFYIITVKEDDADDDPDVIAMPLNRKVNITENVREQILIMLPAINKCSKNCAGLCQICGKNLNEESCECQEDNGHPAFQNLKKIFK